MFYSKDSTVQACAAVEIVQMQQRTKHHFDCANCGHSSRETGIHLGLVKDETIALFVLRLTSLFRSRHEYVTLSSLQALAEIFEVAEDMSKFRDILREDGSLRKLAVFLDSNNADIKLTASRIVSQLTRELEADEQVRFMDLTYNGLNAISSNAANQGLLRLHEVTKRELDDLEKKKHDLEETINTKRALEKKLALSCALLQRPIEAPEQKIFQGTSVRMHIRSKQQKLDFTTSKTLKFIDDDKLRKINEDIPGVDTPADGMNKFFGVVAGSFEKVAQSNCLMLENEAWQPYFLYLLDSTLRCYYSPTDPPQVPKMKVLFSPECQLKLIGKVKGRNHCLQFTHQNKNHFLCFRTAIDAVLWHDLLAQPNAEEEKVDESVNQLRAVREVLARHLNERGVTASYKAFAIKRVALPEHFSMYFGSRLLHSGNLLFSESESPLWKQYFAVVIEGEVRVYKSVESEPDECEIPISMHDSQLAIMRPSTGIAEWNARAFAIADSNSTYYFVVESAEECAIWLNMLSHAQERNDSPDIKFPSPFLSF